MKKIESPKTPTNLDRLLRKPNLKGLHFFFAPNIPSSASNKLRHFLYKCGATVEEFLDRTIDVVVVDSIKPGVEPSSSTPTPEHSALRRILQTKIDYELRAESLSRKNAEQQSNRITTTPKQQSSRITTTTKQQSSRITTTPKQQSSRITTTPKQQSSRITTTPKQQSSRITTTPNQHQPRATNNEQRQSWLKDTLIAIKARTMERQKSSPIQKSFTYSPKQSPSTPKAGSNHPYETAFNKTMETAKKLGIRVVNIKIVLSWLPTSCFKSPTSTSGKKETVIEKIPMLKPCLKLDDGIRKPVFEQALDLPIFNYTRSSQKRENSTTTTTGMTFKATATSSSHEDNDKKSGDDSTKKSDQQQPRKKPQQQQRRGYCERCEKSYLSESKHLKSEEHCRFDDTEGNFVELKQYIEEKSLGMDVFFAKYGQKMDCETLAALRDGHPADYENLESPPFTKSEILLVPPPLMTSQSDPLLSNPYSPEEELMPSEVLFPALSPLADANSQMMTSSQ